MSLEKVMEYLEREGFGDRVRFFDVSSATVELAAKALGCEAQLIAKTLAFKDNSGGAIVIVTAGDTKINNGEFKRRFGFKPSMLSSDETFSLTGYKVGGVCPFALPDDVSLYLDISLRRFSTFYPAAGSTNSAIEMTAEDLERIAQPKSWIDIAKSTEQQA